MKAAGKIEKIPGGRRPKPRPAATGDVEAIDRARAVMIRERVELPALSSIPWEDQSHPERLNTLTGKALETVRDILDLPCDPQNLKLLSIQKDAALSVLSTQTKVDESRFRERRTDQLATILKAIVDAAE